METIRNKTRNEAIGINDSLNTRAAESEQMGRTHYLSYLYAVVRQTPFYLIVRRLLRYFRRFRLISRILKILSSFFYLIEVGTAVFLVTALGLILLPIALIIALCLALVARISYQKENRRMMSRLKAKRVILFFPSREGEMESGLFWRRNIRELSQSPNTVILIISPFLYSGKGLYDKSFYLLTRSESKNIYLIRRHYFFSLRKKVLACAKRVISVF